MLKIEDIRNVVPHRYPFLLVDRILEVDPGRRAIGLKNVTINEAFFEGHFPGHAVMPGVLLVEAMAQVGGVILLTIPENRGKLAYFAGLDKVRFRKPVVPGDALISEVEIIRHRGNFGKVKAVARVDGEVVVDGILLFSVVERERPLLGSRRLAPETPRSGVANKSDGQPLDEELAAGRGGSR
jgi:3-hydroxyacyl-[acyl-carrier-protein] dehydratase